MKKNTQLKLHALGRRVTTFTKLETFPTPRGVVQVEVISDEVTSLCPVTGQPDQYVVKVLYNPAALCAESKTIKLFLQSFRQAGHFCEDFSRIIAERFMKDVKPYTVQVEVTQKPRGGVSIVSRCCLPNNEIKELADEELFEEIGRTEGKVASSPRRKPTKKKK